MKQLHMLATSQNAYGGDLLKTRKGRSSGRPLATKTTMHLVLRSSKAKGAWSFRKHQRKISALVSKFSKKYGVKILSIANVGNHLHLQIQLSSRHTYRPFIRALTSAIAMAVTGVSRWNKLDSKLKFWDYRPFTRVIKSFKEFLNLKDYIRINQLEGAGYRRDVARWIVRDEKFSSA